MTHFSTVATADNMQEREGEEEEEEDMPGNESKCLHKPFFQFKYIK